MEGVFALDRMVKEGLSEGVKLNQGWEDGKEISM